ncbi:glycosyltransferase family 2 protein [Spiribacter halobius]|uniref:Glycosyl transferase family 2 n=1 Tax=Sediminicurvatus halobius TaxID=2182432 RepID=A0A2U2MYD2_9GAMM|nr:glycosyltransferase family A protein [Spiribacter halobius]PWG61714.1 glycosyl transferase family 2 [Spiribacter halobius]UEX77338.1 glycosyltransferase family 2 protein [Spiribacter halobius]
MTPQPDAPLVSVVVPAYNAAWCLARAVDSVLAQDYRPIEVLVVDDGSTDATAAIAEGYGDPVRLIRKPNGGLSSARNAGIAEAKGELIAFLDADDWWLPGKLQAQVELMQAQPGLAFCSTATRVVDAEGDDRGVWGCPAVTRSPLHAIFERNAAVAGSGSAVLARREALKQAGPFDEALRSLEDVDQWMRLASVGGYTCLEEPLTVIEKRADSMSGNLDVMRQAALTVLRKNRHLLPENDRGRFWQACYATVLADYAKWETRAGRRTRAAMHLIEGGLRAPVARGRLCASLLVATIVGAAPPPRIPKPSQNTSQSN